MESTILVDIGSPIIDIVQVLPARRIKRSVDLHALGSRRVGLDMEGRRSQLVIRPFLYL